MRRFGMRMADELFERLLALARHNSRSLNDELIHAAERHLAAPPRLAIVDDSPALPDAEVAVDAGKKVRGRPAKRKGV
jgi:hypothetical protein